MSKETIKSENKKAYELAFHLVPTLGDEKANKVFEEVINLVEKHKGNVISKSEPALLDLEYQMEKTVDSVKLKFNSAYFAWVIFSDADVIELKEELDLNKDVIRFLLIKTEQNESIQASEVANLLNEVKEGQKTFEEEKIEENEEVIDEQTEQISEIEKDQTEESKEVDEAIDELVK